MAGSVYEGKTKEEAIRKGLEALRLTRAEAVITTIEEGKGGFLGLGARPFRVSVARRPGGAIREPSERPRETRASDDRRGGRKGGREERGGRGGRGGREAEAAGRAGSARGGEERGAGSARGGEERAGGSARGGSEERGGRPARAGRGGERATGGRAAGEERAPRGGRGDRREQPAASEHAPRGGRGEQLPRREPAARGSRAELEPTERLADEGARPHGERARKAAPPEHERHAAPIAPAPEAAAADEGDGPRKRRRRGRRGGRGRRRGGPDGAPEATAMNGVESVEAGDFDEPSAVEFAPPPVAAPATFEPAPARSYERVPEPVEPEPAIEAPVARAEREERHAARPSHAAAPRSGGDRAPDMDVDELSRASRRITEDLLKAMGFEPKVSVRAEGNRVDVTVEVDRDDDLLNGRQGETRLALQHLLNRFLNRGDGSRYHLQLEVNDFWQQRETELTELARRLAEEAASRNAEVVSDYLNSQERRILHVTLKEDARVKTFSLGSGALKRVAVAPAGFPERSEDDPS
jgi:predicted RNA-binding protein Jag